MTSKLGVLFALAALGCNAPDPPGSTGGTNVQAGVCGRGFTVVSSDYQSSNVSLVGVDGRVLSSSFMSSATDNAELSAKLSGDVVLPTAVRNGAEIVLLDRSAASVLTWVDVATATVTGQLGLADFKANPHDYIELSPEKAYVTRFGVRDPEAKTGSDILVVDPSLQSAISRIDLRSAMQGAGAGFLPTPGRGVQIGGRVLVVLEAYSANDFEVASSRLVAIDPESDAILEWRTLDGLYGCEGLAVAPESDRVAISCLGRFENEEPTLDGSGIAILDTGPGLAEVQRVSAAEAAGAPLGFGLAWVSGDSLVFTTSGSLNPDFEVVRPDTLVELTLATGEHRELLRSKTQPFVIGDVSCASACGVCVASDAEQNRLAYFTTDAADALALTQSITVDERIGLPPRVIGRF